MIKMSDSWRIIVLLEIFCGNEEKTLLSGSFVTFDGSFDPSNKMSGEIIHLRLNIWFKKR